MVTRGWVLAGGFAGRRGRRPLRLAREGRRREAAPHPALRGHLPPRGKARVVVEGFIPPGVLAAGEAAAGWGHPALRMGIWKRPRGLRGHPFPGRRTVGAGHARPGGLRGHPSMVRSVGRGLDPSAGGNPGKDVGASLRRASGTPPPAVCPGMSGSGSLPLIRPCGATFPQGGKARAVWRRRKVSRGVGDAAPYGLPGMGGGGSLPLIRPCGATFPQGGRQGLLLAAAGACPLPRQLVLGAELEGQAVVPAV